MKKNKLRLVAISAFVLYISNSSIAMNPKYDHWQTPSYFRGFNVLNENPKTQQDFIDLGNSGANFAQLGCFGFRQVTFPYSIIQSNINEMDSLVSWCRNADLHYTIAVRQGPGRRDVYLESNNLAPRSTIWTDQDEQRLYAGMLKEIVQRYANDSLFAGINMIVEPNPMFDSPYSINPSLLQYGLTSNGIDLNAIYNILIDSIRSGDSLLPVIAENAAYSNPEYFSIMQPIADPFIVYDFHCYAPQQFSGEAIPLTQSYPGDYFSLTTYSIQPYNKNFLQTVTLQNIIAFQQMTSAPILMGEFGLKNPQNGGETYLADLADIAVCNGWHFALWDYRRGSAEWNYEQMGNSYWTTVQNMFVANCSGVGMNEIAGERHKLFEISPNPSNGKFNISTQQETKQFQLVVYNSVGAKVYESEISEHENGFDLFFLPPGIYCCLIRDTQHKTATERLITR